jgi:hypothetical protein
VDDEYVTQSEQYGYPLKVRVDFTLLARSVYHSRIWNYFYLLEPPVGSFVHLEFRRGPSIGFVHENNGKRVWINSDAIDSILIDN